MLQIKIKVILSQPHSLIGKSCVIVLIGSQTAGRPWVEYEIKKGWADKKAMFGINIHGLKDSNGYIARKGRNPFSNILFQGGGSLADHITVYDPTGHDSQQTYANIQNNLQTWIENAARNVGR